MRAAVWGHAEIVRELLERGGDRFLVDHDALCALDYARLSESSESEEIVALIQGR